MPDWMFDSSSTAAAVAAHWRELRNRQTHVAIEAAGLSTSTLPVESLGGVDSGR